MKFFIDNWLLLSIALTSGGLLIWPLLKGATAKGLTSAAAVTLINREKGVLIDVSEPEEFAQAHAIGAKNCPLNQFEDKLPGLVKNKAVPVIFVCPTGARSLRAVAVAKTLGYAQPQALASGLKAWREANLPIESSAAGNAQLPVTPATSAKTTADKAT